ncbi:hypothetical protein D3C78_900970 [compost metagenome]
MAADVHCHIQHFAGSYPHQLVLGVFNLIMQTAQYTFLRAGMIVLNEMGIDARGFLKRTLVETLEEEASFVTEHFRFDNKNIRQRTGGYFH